MALLPRRPRYAATALGAALALGFLANGLLPILTLLPLALFTLWPAADRWQRPAAARRHDPGCTALRALLLPLQMAAPDYFTRFFRSELAALSRPVTAATNVLRYLNLLLWYAWPALPLAVWALWSKRRIAHQAAGLAAGHLRFGAADPWSAGRNEQRADAAAAAPAGSARGSRGRQSAARCKQCLRLVWHDDLHALCGRRLDRLERDGLRLAGAWHSRSFAWNPASSATSPPSPAPSRCWRR